MTKFASKNYRPPIGGRISKLRIMSKFCEHNMTGAARKWKSRATHLCTQVRKKCRT